ncbi:MAG: molybdopterin-guanine dinucleotide biosynthesis protein B [Nitrospiraceae bacterium]
MPVIVADLSPPNKTIMPTPILSIVGRSNSGKTTLVERLIPELVVAGYRIATIKHAGHGFDLDTEGKDSWRHKRAGAGTVIVVSKGSLAMFADVSDEIKVEELRDRFVEAEYDLILAEGWKGEGYPKIVVVRDQAGEVAISPEGLLAVVSNKPIELSVPVFDPDDIKGLSEFIIRRFPKA